MNYVLENYKQNILDHNLDSTDPLIDNQFETTATLKSGESNIYLKIEANEVNFFAFHNIYAEYLTIAIFNSLGVQVGETITKQVLSSNAQTCKDVLLRKRLFVRSNILVEFPKNTNQGGYAEIRIYPHEGEAFLGSFASGIPTELGFLSWGWTDSMENITYPVLDQNKNIMCDSTIIIYEKKVNMNVFFTNGAKNKAFIQDNLDRLSAKVQEEIITGYDDDSTPIKQKKWVNTKVTFIEPNHTRDVMWCGIEGYSFKMTGVVVTELNIKLKGFKR